MTDHRANVPGRPAVCQARVIIPRCRILTACSSCLCSAASRAPRQGLPSLSPINPVAASRSGLSFEPYHDARPGRWTPESGAGLRQHHRVQRAAAGGLSARQRAAPGRGRRDPGSRADRRSCCSMPRSAGPTPVSWTASSTGTTTCSASRSPSGNAGRTTSSSTASAWRTAPRSSTTRAACSSGTPGSASVSGSRPGFRASWRSPFPRLPGRKATGGMSSR